jgi:hypothetical protein
VSAGIFDYSVAGSSAWFDPDVFTSNDPGQAAGWYDLDYLQPPITSGPLTLYYLQGGGDPWIFNPVTETFDDPSGLYSLGVPWQVIDELGDAWKPGATVSWNQFENRVVLSQKREAGDKEFRRLAKELAYKHDYGRLVQTTIKVAGTAYVVWRILKLLP